MAKKAVSEVVSEREAARLAKHHWQLDERRRELGRQIAGIAKEQAAIEARLTTFVLDVSPRDRLALLARFVLQVRSVASSRYISWKGVCTERLGEAVVRQIEAAPPVRDVLEVKPRVDLGGARGRAA